MILATHILIATAASKPFFNSHPAVVLAIAIASHFLSDAIPHWNYSLKTLDKRKTDNGFERVANLTKESVTEDLLKIFVDILIGTFLAFLLISYSNGYFSLSSVLLAIFGGILPDATQPIFYFWKTNNPFMGLQIFHEFIHTETELGRFGYAEKKYVLIGMISQIMICLIAASLILGT